MEEICFLNNDSKKGKMGKIEGICYRKVLFQAFIEEKVPIKFPINDLILPRIQ